MGFQTSVKKNACVFFARDFLSSEFSSFGCSLSEYIRVYLVSNESEKNTVRQNDPEAYVYSLHNVVVNNNLDEKKQIEVSFNNDRYLRYYDDKEITRIVSLAAFLVKEITKNFDVKYYFDEPVSGFLNDYFNRNFRDIGATCLHFHFAWVPGYIFFTQDPAQREPVQVSCLGDMSKVVSDHIANRLKGKMRPGYVIGYESKVKVISDVFGMFAKGIYRKIFRRGEFYLNADPASHFFHVRCLLKSVYASYGNVPLVVDQAKYVVLPLHYEPEAVINYFSEFRRQVELAERLIDTLPAGFKLIIKEHPSQPGALAMPQWQNVVKCSRVISLQAHADVKDLFKHQIYVVSIGSTFALEAALYGKPVAIIGGAHFVGAPNVIGIDNPEDWHKLFKVELNHDPNALVEWYSLFMQRYCVKGVIMKCASDMSMVSKYIDRIDE